MHIAVSELIPYYRPSECGLRAYLKKRGHEEEPRSEFDELLVKLGRKHEKDHLSVLGKYLDISLFPEPERVARTKEAVASGTAVIYQGTLSAALQISGQDVVVTGQPDFLVRQPAGHVIRDSKISLRITEEDHPEIFLQMQLYGWLFEQTFGVRPVALEVHSGRGTVVPIPNDTVVNAFKLLQMLLNLYGSKSEPYSPVGWTKCSGCCFRNYCWSRAVANRDVALVMGVDQGLASTLHNDGILTRADLLSRHDQQSLGDIRRPHGTGYRKVGTAAAKILRMADVMDRNCEVILMRPAIPDCPNYCMFDLEGMPSHMDELEKVYLWGLQVFGENRGEYLPATARFGPNGERDGWDQFLDNAESIFANYGNIPIVHWSPYERIKLDLYIRKFGDRNGVAQRVRANLLDLHSIATMSVALPLPSYSLKVIEKYVGYKRTLDEYGGDWSMARYIEATESEDDQVRMSVMDKILAYNREDLEATWAVLQWLKEKSPAESIDVAPLGSMEIEQGPQRRERIGERDGVSCGSRES